MASEMVESGIAFNAATSADSKPVESCPEVVYS